MDTHIVTVRLGDPEAFQLRAMSESGEVLASIRLRELYECKSLGLLFGLETREAYRRQGIASSLLLEAETVARRENMGALVCTIWSENLPSRGLFAKQGFISVGDWHSPITEHDLILYRKVLRNPEQ